MNLNNTPYHIEKPLGGGGSASVYQAIERATGKKIALKVAKRGAEGLIQQEGQLIQQIASKVPNVRRVVNTGQMPTGEFYVAYEFLPSTLGTYIKERRKQNKPFSLSEAAEILMPIAKALDQLHDNYQLAHSDLKPDNILMGEAGSVRLADFGNATPFGKQALQVSPFYMTPEQANNQPCQAASDVYGLALILYEMLTLSRPIQGDNAVTMSIQVLNQKPIPIQNVRLDIKADLAENIMSGLQKNPAARPKKASALLAGFPPPQIKHQTPISPPPNNPKARAEQKKIAALLALLTILFLAILGGGGYLLGIFDDFLEPTMVVEEASPEESPTVSPEPVESAVTSLPTVETDENEDENELVETQEPTEESISNGEGTATRRPTATSTRRPTATSTPLATATSSSSVAASPTFIIEVSPSFISEPTSATTTPPATLTEIVFVTPTSVPEVTNTAENTAETTLLVEEVTTIVAPTIINSTPLPPPTVAPSATIQPTAIILPTVTPPPTALPPMPTVAPQPTRTATKPPPTPTNYNQAPELISPSKGEVIKSDIVTFEWKWNAPRLIQGQQFLVRGFRDSEWFELSRSTTTTVEVFMGGHGNFETDWKWHVVVIDQTGKEISPVSSTESFGISIPKN